MCPNTRVFATCVAPMRNASIAIWTPAVRTRSADRKVLKHKGIYIIRLSDDICLTYLGKYVVRPHALTVRAPIL